MRNALSAGAATVLCAAYPAAAQTATEDGNDIIVTATKGSERQQEVPASISVVSATALSEEGVVRFVDYAARVPGLSFTSGRTGITQITLRGIATGAAQPGSTTGYYIDEAPVGSVNAYTGGNAITPDLDPTDLAQIEVLKGPQGTLYGAGAVGGLLKFTTATPDLAEWGGRASAGLVSIAHGDIGYSARGMLNIPLAADELGLRVSGFYRRDGGYIDNINPRVGKNDINVAKVRGGRAVLSMRFGPDVSLDVSALAQDTTTDGTNSIDVDAATLKPIYGKLKQSRVVREQGFMRLRLYNATLRAELGGVDLVSSTTYQRIYFRELGDGTRGYGAALGPLFGLTDLGVRLNTIKHTKRWSEEARVGANGLMGGMLDLQAGFYWTHETNTNRIPGIDTFSTTTGTAYPLPPIAIAAIDSTYEEYSFFGNARLYLGEKFDILGGVRFAHDKQDYLQDYQGLIVGPRLIVPGHASDNVTNWMISPRFRPSSDLMIYGRVATGYRPGGPNPAPPTGNIPLTFEPDKLTQYEVGLKASTPDRLLTIDTALFYTDWKNVQIQTSAGGFNYLVNGGSVRSQGGEATLRYRSATGLTLTANAGYTDAKLTADAPAAGGLKGDRLPYVPRWTGSLSADYAMPLGGSKELTLGARLNYVGSRVSEYANRFPKPLADYATLDLRAGVDLGGWSLSAFARNVTDTRAIVVAGQQGLAASATPGAFYSASMIQPRTIGAEAAIRF
jgi:outer membrane receptor protein involved in Fe transport